METATVERLDQRLCAVEEKVESIYAKISAVTVGEHTRSAAHSRSDRAHAVAVLDQIIARYGEPPQAKRHPRELRAELIARGWDPNDNSGSREIIRMREE